tara:strand:+ start:313 stop:999 length:687 start_codon:yes stop_codon:yes gene_type:complete
MRKDNLLLQRIKELNYLTNDEDLVFCLYPFSFALKELIKTNLEESKCKRKFTSTIEETKNILISTENKYFIFISEYLKDGLGTKLLMELKSYEIDHNCIIFLNGNDKNNLNVALQLKTKGMVHEESLEEKNGSLVRAVKNIKEGKKYVDPKLMKILKENEININTPLTNRHIEIVQLLREGFSNQEISEKLLISSNTVRDHLKEIMRRLNTNSRTSVVNISLRLGLIK